MIDGKPTKIDVNGVLVLDFRSSKYPTFRISKNSETRPLLHESVDARRVLSQGSPCSNKTKPSKRAR